MFPYLFPTQRHCGILKLTRPTLALSFFRGKMREGDASLQGGMRKS